MKGDRQKLLIRLNERMRIMDRTGESKMHIEMTYNELWAAAGALRMAEEVKNKEKVKYAHPHSM